MVDAEVFHNAQLPARYLQFTIDDLQPGQSAWVFPEAMVVDLDLRCWLQPWYPIQEGPDSLANMKVSRLQRTFAVDLTTCGSPTWLPEDVDIEDLVYVTELTY